MSAVSSLKATFASGANASFIESLYRTFRDNPEAVDPTWRAFFEGYEFGASSTGTHDDAAPGDAASTTHAHEHAKVEAMINAYRRLGHLSAHLSPLEDPPFLLAELTKEGAGLAGVSDDTLFHPANLPQGGTMRLGDILALMRETYCGRVGADFRELNDVELVRWLQEAMETTRNRAALSVSQRRRVIEKLVAAEGLERFLQARFLGQKRFSLEGLDALIPMLDVLISEAAQLGVEELGLGMAHRGRLNVLTNILGKPYEKLFVEFDGSEHKPFDIDGDVKYHMGYANKVRTENGHEVRLYLSPNPSHLEAVNPVLTGFVRARQDRLGDKDRSRVMPILLHGDAAFAGQGIVAETLNLCALAAYETGGTIHVITNNQVGFTTNPQESRSTDYSSAMAKIIRAPVLHVNADDPEAVVGVTQLAVRYRQKFHRDIVIDLIGYRRHGHNETDEPEFTQPLMYKKVKGHPSVLELYSKALDAEGRVQRSEVTQVEQAFRERLQASLDAVRKGQTKVPPPAYPQGLAEALDSERPTPEAIEAPAATRVPLDVLRSVHQRACLVPADFNIHPKVAKLLETRRAMLEGAGAVDWAMAELLAFGTLACEGHPVRLSGQDCRRGTFSSRQAVWVDVASGKSFFPLQQLSPTQASLDIHNSPLSEQGCLGFEFGYAVASRNALVLWEAQFGDFANGAQIIIDQFLVASEAKWKQTCGLALLLPHGYEGQGPEHSSARPERFLQLCGNFNIQVATPTTPAQYFHFLRRQVKRPFLKPLVIMSPKSLLRHPKVVSPVSAFVDGGLQEVIDDPSTESSAAGIDRVILCTGKVYYDLVDARAKAQREGRVAIIRVEQMYPFPAKLLRKALARYPQARSIVWAQEEPLNMGSWTFVRPKLKQVLGQGQEPEYCGRADAGTTAEGSLKAHQAEQQRIVTEAVGR